MILAILYSKKNVGVISNQDTHPGLGFHPWLGHVWEAANFFSFS